VSSIVIKVIFTNVLYIVFPLKLFLYIEEVTSNSKIILELSCN